MVAFKRWVKNDTFWSVSGGDVVLGGSYVECYIKVDFFELGLV